MKHALLNMLIHVADNPFDKEMDVDYKVVLLSLVQNCGVNLPYDVASLVWLGETRATLAKWRKFMVSIGRPTWILLKVLWMLSKVRMLVPAL
jgi:hypothetical protein